MYMTGKQPGWRTWMSARRKYVALEFRGGARRLVLLLAKDSTSSHSYKATR